MVSGNYRNRPSETQATSATINAQKVKTRISLRSSRLRLLRACEYGLPQLFSVIEMFAKRIRPATNYSLFIAEMPRWFRAEVLKNLDEQGVPVQISERFLVRGDTIDTLRKRLIQEAKSQRDILT